MDGYGFSSSGHAVWAVDIYGTGRSYYEMSDKLSHEDVFGDRTDDPLESEHTVQFYVETLSKAALEEMSHAQFLQNSQHKTHEQDGQEEQVVAAVDAWFDEHVPRDEFDDDVYKAARKRTWNRMVSKLPEQKQNT